MKTEEFSEALGDIRDGYLEEAIHYKAKRRLRAPIWLAAAACLCLLIGGALWLRHRALHPWPVKYVQCDSVQDTEVAFVPQWEDEPIYRQYPGVALDGTAYSVHGAVVPAERLGAVLGPVTVEGYDIYTDEAKLTEATICAITGISTECAAAICYDGTDEYYAMVNSAYRPATLGQFIDDLCLREEITFGTVYYSYQNAAGEHVSVQFEDVDSGKIWSLLLSASEAENIWDDTQATPDRILGISVDLPLLGYENISLSVHQGGYISTNILDTGKMFHVGEENAGAFVDYVLEECEGYEIVYVTDEPEDHSPADSGAEEPISVTEASTEG